MQTSERPQKPAGYYEFLRCFVPIKLHEKQLLHLKMKAHSADFIWATLISLPLLLLRCEALAVSVYNTVNDNALVCRDGFMSVYISKAQFADMPFTIYVRGKSRR